MKCSFLIFRPFHPKKIKSRNRSQPIIATITEPFSDHWILLYMFLSILIKCGTRMNEWMMTWRSSSCKSFLSSFFITTKTEINLLGVSLGLLWNGGGKEAGRYKSSPWQFSLCPLKKLFKSAKKQFQFFGSEHKRSAPAAKEEEAGDRVSGGGVEWRHLIVHGKKQGCTFF